MSALNISCGKTWRIALAGFFFFPSRLYAQQQPDGPYHVSGTVVNGITREPLERATVSLTPLGDASRARSVQTGVDGRFKFDHLPADKYSLSGSRRGFITASYDEHEQYSTAIVTGDGLQSENLLLRVVPDAVISGTVTEDSGDPVENAQVSLYRVSHDRGIEEVQLFGRTQADNTGEYEFHGLPSGSYYLSVMAKPWYAEDNQGIVMNDTQSSLHDAEEKARNAPRSPVDMVYRTTFYADVMNQSDASPIPLQGGDRVKIDFALHPMPALHLVVHTAVEDPRRDGGLPVPSISQKIFGMTEPIPVNTRFLAPGLSELSVAPGEYQLNVSGPPGGNQRFSSVSIASDQTVDTNAGTVLARISGKLQQTTGEAFSTNSYVSLSSSDGRNASTSGVSQDGMFEMFVPPDKYKLTGWINGKRLLVSKVASTEADRDQQWMTIGSNPVMIAATVYADPNLAITGFAIKDGKPAPGAMIVLVPKDSANNRDLFRRDQSDLDGSFDLLDVLPGQYTVVAIEDGWNLDWASPDVIAHYLQRGQSVTVTERNAKTTKLKETVEVQPK